MDHQQKSSSQRSSGAGTTPELAAAAVRTRWTPKPEQILILGSIFNSGMVNPRKDETIKIRKLLEQFGPVGDANIFYWFQNQRSRARRRQRQLQASGQLVSTANSNDAAAAQPAAGSGGVNPNGPTSSTMMCNNYHGGAAAEGGLMFPSAATADYSYNSCSNNSSCSNMSVMDDSAGDLFSITQQMGFMESANTATPFVCSSDLSQLHHQSAGSSSVMVFIDGVLSEVPRGPIDLRSAFGQNVMLLHSSGELLPINEHGILTHSLQMGESYFLVTKPN